MQITSDKCGNAPGGNCHDPAYNIATGSAYFKDRLDSYNGNVLLALGVSRIVLVLSSQYKSSCVEPDCIT